MGILGEIGKIAKDTVKSAFETSEVQDENPVILDYETLDEFIIGIGTAMVAGNDENVSNLAQKCSAKLPGSFTQEILFPFAETFRQMVNHYSIWQPKTYIDLIEAAKTYLEKHFKKFTGDGIEVEDKIAVLFTEKFFNGMEKYWDRVVSQCLENQKNWSGYGATRGTVDAKWFQENVSKAEIVKSDYKSILTIMLDTLLCVKGFAENEQVIVKINEFAKKNSISLPNNKNSKVPRPTGTTVANAVSCLAKLSESGNFAIYSALCKNADMKGKKDVVMKANSVTAYLLAGKKYGTQGIKMSGSKNTFTAKASCALKIASESVPAELSNLKHFTVTLKKNKLSCVLKMIIKPKDFDSKKDELPVVIDEIKAEAVVVTQFWQKNSGK